MKTKPPLLLLLLASGLLSTVPTFANCESGAYLIHTVAEYAELDSSRTWIFRSSLAGNRLEIQPSASTSEASVQRLVAFLRGPHRGQLQIRRGEVACSLEPEESVELARKPELLDRYAASFTICPELAARDGAESPQRSTVLFDRDTKTLLFPTPLEVHPPRQAPVGLGKDAGPNPWELWQERLERLDLRASEAPDADRITRQDIAGLTELRVDIGRRETGYGVVILALRLHHLETLLPDDGYLDPSKIAGAQAEFPVLFLDPGTGQKPVYIGDGRWCSSYRLSMEIMASTGPFLGALERFTVTGAFDTNQDGRPDLLRVNDQVVYRLGGEKALEVVDWGEGC